MLLCLSGAFKCTVSHFLSDMRRLHWGCTAYERKAFVTSCAKNKHSYIQIWRKTCADLANKSANDTNHSVIPHMPDCQSNGWSQENGRPGSYKENKTHLIHIREVISPAFVAFLIYFLFEMIKLTQPVDFMFPFFKEDCEALQ